MAIGLGRHSFYWYVFIFHGMFVGQVNGEQRPAPITLSESEALFMQAKPVFDNHIKLCATES